MLEVRDLTSAWDGVPVLRGVSLDLGPGEFLSLLGPNGSGKTTFLRCLTGLETPTGGTIRLHGERVDRRPVHRRGIGWMSQEPALFPRRSVLENIAYAPLLRGRSDREAREEVAPVIRLLRLEGFEDRAPDQLSGGERQRVALARTLAARPRLVLLDEPFASIDLELRAGLRSEFRHALREFGTAAIHVTHDREEGLFLGDRVGLLIDGRLEALGPPEEVFAHPPTEAAARLLGYAVLTRAGARVAVHPSSMRLVPAPGARLTGRVVAAGVVGPESMTVVATDSGLRLEVRSPLDAPRSPPGTTVGVEWIREVPLPAGAGPKTP